MVLLLVVLLVLPVWCDLLLWLVAATAALVARPGGAGPLVRGRQPEPGRSQQPSPTVVSAHTPSTTRHCTLLLQTPATLALARKKSSKSQQTFQMSTSLAIVFNQTFVNLYLPGLVPTHTVHCPAPTGHQPHTLNLDTGASN